MSPIATVTLAGWVVLELGLRVSETVRGKGGRGRDRGTRVLIAITLGLTLGGASAAATAAPSLRVPAGGRAAGVAVMWLGLGIRAWAVALLGGAFRTTVEVDPDQAVVSTGPYRWIRHPSYAGLLLIVAGFGLAIGTWLSLAVCLLVPWPPFMRRIQVEEAELTRVLGGAYRTYQARTARLIPRIW